MAPHTLFPPLAIKERNQYFYKGNKDFVMIKKTDWKKIKQIEFTTAAEQPLLIYEIVKWGK